MLAICIKVLTVFKGLHQYLITLKTSVYWETWFSFYNLETSGGFLNVATKEF